MMGVGKLDAPAPHVFVPHPGYPDKLCAECGWGPEMPCHVHEAITTTGEETLAPLRSDPTFDYATLERKMWDKIERLVNDEISEEDWTNPRATFPMEQLRVAIRSWGFAYRLAKTETPPVPEVTGNALTDYWIAMAHRYQDLLFGRVPSR